jgi:hypothetical protein
MIHMHKTKALRKKTSDFIFKGSKVSADADSPLQKNPLLKLDLFTRETDTFSGFVVTCLL